jgi:ribosome-associated heat shock protein Hsp15
VPEDGCRIDVWLWRARFFKTRGRAAAMAEAGRIRLTRLGVATRLDKASRVVKPGDELVFAISGRLTAVRVTAAGARRGPPAEARGLYDPLDAPPIGDLDAS